MTAPAIRDTTMCQCFADCLISTVEAPKYNPYEPDKRDKLWKVLVLF